MATNWARNHPIWGAPSFLAWRTLSRRSYRRARLDSQIRPASEEYGGNFAHNLELVHTLRERTALVHQGGGEEAVRRHRARGKLLARVPPIDAAASRAEEVWRALGGWRLNRLEQPSLWELADGSVHEVRVTEEAAHPARVKAAVGDRQLACERVSDLLVSVSDELATLEPVRESLLVRWRGRQYRLNRATERPVRPATPGASGSAGGTLCAPMPGRIVKVAVSAGAWVESHQTLVVREAMKMEHAVRPPHAGRVVRITAREGEQVPANAALIELSRSAEEER